MAVPTAAVAEMKASVGTSAKSSNEVVSTTNTQVLWVDEADTVKTDGKNIYSYSENNREVRIVSTAGLTLEKRITLPEGFYGVSLYLQGDRLILVGQKYSTNSSYTSMRWYAPETKSLIAIYRISSPSTPVLEHYTEIDGMYQDSRVIDDRLYLISRSDLRLPPVFMTPYLKDANGWEKSLAEVSKSFSLKRFAPEIRESTRNAKWKYLQSIRSSVANCKDVTFVLPDATTLKNIDFTPSLISLSSVDIDNPTAKMTSQMIFGDVSQIHMSKSALYLTSVISETSMSTCPRGAKCFAPSYTYTSATLVHKYALSGAMLNYQYTTTVAWNPMNQYSMDEDASGNFRIVTQKYAWTDNGNANTTGLYVISAAGKTIGKLEWLAPGENFQSSRFIGNRLYLVTFQQIDPLFVIDVADTRNPKVLWELKIPGYSTYLHPYDADRLIGLWYDTHTNQWGGTQNAGLKVDLYNVADVKNPRQESSLILGDAGSSSEALSNPRAFVYYKEKNLLLLPATLMTSAKDPNNTYLSKSAWQWVVGVTILPSAITEKFRVSHLAPLSTLDTAWKKDCAQYKTAKYAYGYTPDYCKPSATLDMYRASNLWNESRDFIDRVVYVGERLYTIGESSIRSWSLSDTSTPTGTLNFSGSTVSPLRPIPVMMR